MAKKQKRRFKNVLWMKITTDEYELPLGVYDSVREMAEADGKRTDTVFSIITHYRQRGHKSPYIKVIFDEDLEDDL